MKFHDLNNFSFKDLIAILALLLFIGVVIYTLKSHDTTGLAITQSLIPVVISIFGVYGGTELTQMFRPNSYSNNYNNSSTITPINNNTIATSSHDAEGNNSGV